jgi:hypothetical protein
MCITQTNILYITQTGTERARLARYEKSGLTGTGVPIWTLVYLIWSCHTKTLIWREYVDKTTVTCSRDVELAMIEDENQNLLKLHGHMIFNKSLH